LTIQLLAHRHLGLHDFVLQKVQKLGFPGVLPFFHAGDGDRAGEFSPRIESRVHAVLSSPDLYRGDPEGVLRATAESESLTREIETAFARWAELSEVGA
jgi:hypothetical protein